MATTHGTRDGSEIAVAFSRVLRGAGVDVPTSSTIAFSEALAATGLDDRDTTYWTGRATLIRRPEDHDLYDRAFRVFWDHATGATANEPDEEPLQITLAVDDGSGDDDNGPDQADASDDPVIELRFSTTEVLRRKDFAEYTTDELIQAQQLMSRLRLVGSPPPGGTRNLSRIHASEISSARALTISACRSASGTPGSASSWASRCCPSRVAGAYSFAPNTTSRPTA